VKTIYNRYINQNYVDENTSRTENNPSAPVEEEEQPSTLTPEQEEEANRAKEAAKRAKEEEDERIQQQINAIYNELADKYIALVFQDYQVPRHKKDSTDENGKIQYKNDLVHDLKNNWDVYVNMMVRMAAELDTLDDDTNRKVDALAQQLKNLKAQGVHKGDAERINIFNQLSEATKIQRITIQRIKKSLPLRSEGGTVMIDTRLLYRLLFQDKYVIEAKTKCILTKEEGELLKRSIKYIKKQAKPSATDSNNN